MPKNLNILPDFLLSEYLEQLPRSLQEGFDALEDAEISSDTFSFYTSVASVFSSKIEGEDIELDSYIKHKKFGAKFQADYTKKTDDLYEAYTFAKNAELNEENLSEAHRILSKHILTRHQQGKLRTQNMFVASADGKIDYVAATPLELAGEMDKFYKDLEVLLAEELSIEKVFFFASLLHLVFVKIHPWNDGNGRSARLLEKWFLAQKLGDKAWFIDSERQYYHQHQSYYKNIRLLGLEYPDLDYSRALPFLLMLPAAIKR